MRGELIAIDLETTGLDVTHDAVIEVGAVRMRDGKIIDEYTTFVNPGVVIPALVTQLTGITDTDVAQAPIVEQIMPLVRDFAGDAPLIAHNISLDAGFLYRYDVLKTNLRLDTHDLAAVLMPRAARYTLSSLASELGVEMGHAHRALEDARAAALLYWKLWQKMLKLPSGTLREICDAGKNLDWDAKVIFEAALREQHDNADNFKLESYFSTGHHSQPLSKSAQSPRPIDPTSVTNLIEQEGSLAVAIPDFEHRPQQLEMARAITEAFNTSQHLLVEAGTGTGKSLAYLLPSTLWALNNNERVVISTHTLNLQDQLIQQDIPVLASAINTPFNACVMKGRGNYLCPRRLLAVRRRRPTNVDELRTLAKILIWLLDTDSGDKSEITLRGPIEQNIWQRLSAEDEDCTLERCETMMAGTCPFYKARKAADSAHLVIVNHALLISDALADHRVLPDYAYLVVDEAHQLEDAITQGMTNRIDEALLLRLLADLGTTRTGILGDLVHNAREYMPAKESQRLENFIQGIDEATAIMRVHIVGLFRALGQFMEEVVAEKQSDLNLPLRMSTELRGKTGFAQVQTTATTLDEFFEVIADAMSRLATALGRMEKYNISAYDDLVNSTASAARHLDTLRKQLYAFIGSPDSRMIYWLSAWQGLNELTIYAAPLHVGRLVEEQIWQRMESAVLTSGTLRSGENFDYIHDRLSAHDVKTLELGSPFDYRASTLIYVPEDIPEPNDRIGYQQAVERGLIELAAALNGRVMALFTSFAQLRQTAQAITPRLALGDIAVYGQSDGASRQALLEGFKSAEKAVLLGTRSFWEGVDIPGESLSALVIVRLPFAVPTDPVFAARSETYKDSFKDYALPDALLRFRQGFGRLIRKRTDRGIVTIFDSRVLSKGYGLQFIESLPECTTRRGPLQRLPEEAKEWLKKS